MRAHSYNYQNPSFSSSLLDEIYRSISESDLKHHDLNYTDTMPQNQTKKSRLVEQDRRGCLIDQWIDRKFGQKVPGVPHNTKSRYVFEEDAMFFSDPMPQNQIKSSRLVEKDRRLCIDREVSQNRKSRRVFEEDAVLFSSTSISSDSSSGGFSSSDTESFSGGRKSKPKPKSSVSAPVPPIRPQPVKTRPEKQEKTEETPTINDSMSKSKLRASKIYKNLKNLKQPISPGGKLVNFVNSLFTKSKHSSSSSSIDKERKLKSKQAPTCSSAQSFSRSCLSKPEKFHAGVQRSVRFYPVSVIADEERLPCGHKPLYEREESQSMSVSFPAAWKIGKSSEKLDDDLKYQVMDKSRRVEEVARDFLREYQKKNANKLIDEDEDDNAMSDSSSDLFELDNLSLIGKDGEYSKELPVYETTHVSINRAIAKGLRL